jgi:hypothetical protein
MDRITHQPPRQQGYGSTSSIRNDSLKHTRKHERKERGIEPRNKAARLWRTVRPGGADCPHGPRGPSGCVPRTVRTGTADRPTWAADCPSKLTEPLVATPNNGPSAGSMRTVRQAPADCLPWHTRTVRNLAQPKHENTTDRKRRRARTQRTHDEQLARGPSTSPSRTVRALRTEPETARPRKSTPPIHHRISQTVEAVETRVWGHDKRQTRMLYPKICLPPNSLNHRESRIL